MYADRGAKFLEDSSLESEVEEKKADSQCQFIDKQNLPGNALPITFRKTCPYKDIDEYRISKLGEKDIKQTTKWEISRNCTGIYLFNAKRDLKEKDLLLERFRRNARNKRKIFDKKWNELSDQEKSYRALFVKFNKFVKENQEKRDRAAKKIADEKVLLGKRMLDIELMEGDFKRLSNTKAIMEQKVRQHRIYEDYLSSVITSSGLYKNVNDILSRYESLIESRNDLGAKQMKDFSSLQNAHTSMMRLVEEKGLTLIGLQNQLISLQIRYEVARSKSLQWESTVSKIQDIYSFEIAKIHLVKSSIDYMFADMRKRDTSHVAVDVNDYEAKLAFVKKHLRQLKRCNSNPVATTE